MDSKLVSQLLAARLEEFRLLNILHYSSQTNHRGLAVSLDAEKVFDRAEWEYVFDALGRFGLGGEFLKWIKRLYNSPQACVVTNGTQTALFPLCGGTRQGCPLSSLLFTLALEPLDSTKTRMG